MDWVERIMRTKGRLRSWNHDRGFGFVESSDGEKDVFLHISAFRNRDRRPEIGQIVTYALSTDNRGRPQAVNATLPGDRLSGPKKRNGKVGAVIVAAGFFSLVAFSVASGRIPFFIFLTYLAVSLITFFVYAVDKVAAKDGAWRTSESTLHLLSLAGGWPGALFAQQSLRHKSKKQSFRSVFWITVFLNVCVFAWMFTPPGAHTVQSWVGAGYSALGLERQATIEWVE